MTHKEFIEILNDSFLAIKPRSKFIIAHTSTDVLLEAAAKICKMSGINTSPKIWTSSSYEHGNKCTYYTITWYKKSHIDMIFNTFKDYEFAKRAVIRSVMES